MRPAPILRAAKQSSGLGGSIPWETYPLIVCSAGVAIFAGWRLTRNYMSPDVRSAHQNKDTSRLPEIQEDHK